MTVSDTTVELRFPVAQAHFFKAELVSRIAAEPV